MNKKNSSQKIGGQMVLFLGIVLLVFFCLLRGKDVRGIIQLVRGARLPYLVGGALLACMFILTEGTNLRILLKCFGHSVEFADGIKYGSTGFFFSSITPSSTGGQPMQLYMMNQDKIMLSHGTLALLMELVSFQSVAFVFEVGAVVVLFLLRIQLEWYMKLLAGFGFIFNGCFIGFLLAVIFSKSLGDRMICFLQWVIGKLPLVAAEKKERWVKKLDEELQEFRECAVIMKQEKRSIYKVLSVSVVQVICWFSVPYMIYLALGQSGVSYGYAFVIQTLIYMISALLPLPGAVGISELAFLQLFGVIYGEKMITAAVLLSRGISFYFLLVLSAVLTVVLQVRSIRMRK